MKMLTLFILLLVTIIGSDAEPVWLYGFGLEDGNQYDYTITREQYEKQPIMDIGEKELPLSPAMATRIALEAIKPLLKPEEGLQLRCAAIQILQMPNPDQHHAVNTKKWYYHISLRTDESVLFRSPSPHMIYDHVLVLMDGTPMILQKKKQG